MNDNFTNATNVGVWSGAVGAALGGVTLTEWLAIGGFVLAFLSFIVNFWHKRALIKIEREKLKLSER